MHPCGKVLRHGGIFGGRFKSNWQLGEGSAPSSTLPDIDPSGSASKARVLAALPPNAAGKVFYLVNNLPYSQKLEDGWSKQAPAGMVMLTVIKWNNIVEDAVKGINPGGGDMAAGFEAYPL